MYMFPEIQKNSCSQRRFPVVQEQHNIHDFTCEKIKKEEKSKFFCEILKIRRDQYNRESA